MPAATARGLGLAASALLWLAFLGFAGSCYALLLPACGIAGLSPLGTCPLRSDGAFAEGAELQQLVEGAELRLRREEAVCRMPRRADAGPTPPPAAR